MRTRAGWPSAAVNRASSSSGSARGSGEGDGGQALGVTWVTEEGMFAWRTVNRR
jgi:hypothetical protein